jgi:hypothetical protein
MPKNFRDALDPSERHYADGIVPDARNMNAVEEVDEPLLEVENFPKVVSGTITAADEALHGKHEAECDRMYQAGWDDAAIANETTSANAKAAERQIDQYSGRPAKQFPGKRQPRA